MENGKLAKQQYDDAEWTPPPDAPLPVGTSTKIAHNHLVQLHSTRVPSVRHTSHTSMLACEERARVSEQGIDDSADGVDHRQDNADDNNDEGSEISLANSDCATCLQLGIVPTLCTEHLLKKMQARRKCTVGCTSHGLSGQSTEELVRRIGEWLSVVVAAQDATIEHTRVTVFDVCDESVGKLISIPEYIVRISTYFASREILVPAMIYLQRAFQNHPDIVSTRTIHRLIISSVVVSAKFNGHVSDLSYVARVGGLQVPELVRLEVQFLSLINWNLFVTEDEYYAAAFSYLNSNP